MAKRRIDDYLIDDTKGGRRGLDDSILLEKSLLEVAKSILDELRGLKDRIDAIEAVLEDLNSRILSIEEKIDKLSREKYTGYIKEKRRSSIRDALLRILDKEAYIVASEVKLKVGVPLSRLINELESIGNITVMDVGGEAVVISNDRLDEFKRILATIKTGDPQEAGEKLGIYKTLFNLMRRSGMVYYDAKTKTWKILS